MKNYTEMTMKEIGDIINRGGNDLNKLNKIVIEHLDTLKLSEKAKDVIATTGIESMAEVFGGLFTAEEVEEYVNEYFTYED